jgi:phytoene dehydrogenase-like protein
LNQTFKLAALTPQAITNFTPLPPPSLPTLPPKPRLSNPRPRLPSLMPAHSPEYDAIVIGSGPNGLTAAACLARRGWKILILEAAPTPGGGTRTQELTLPRFHHDVCSAVHPTAVASPVFHDLDLAAEGLEWIHPEIPLAHPLDHGRAAVLHRSLDLTAEGLAADQSAYHTLFGPLVDHAASLYQDVFSPLQFPSSPLAMAAFGLRSLPPASLLARLAFRTPEARALFAGNAAHSVLPLESPLTSAIGVMLQFSAHAVGWPVACGGSQSIASALLRIIHRHGGQLVTGSRVRSLADLPPSRAVLFDTAPRHLAAIAGDALPPSFRRRLLAFRHGPGVFKIDYALSSPVPWTHPDCRKAGTVHVGGTLEEISLSEADACAGRHAERPFVLTAQPSLCDPSRAPAGRHTFWAYCHVPHGSTRDMRDPIERQIERFAPGFRDTILAARTHHCAEMEAHNPNYVGGDIIGGVTDWRQLLTRPVARLKPHTTPNPRLFLCSASTPPAGGVHGMCGYHAARAALLQHPF